MKFKSKISYSSIFGLSLFALFFIGLAIYFWIKNPENIISNSFLSAFLICLTGFFISLYKTNYEVNSPNFYYKSGFYKGKISITAIKRIDAVDSIWNLNNIIILSSNFAPALGNSGLMIYYSKHHEIYISPAESEQFLEELLKINPNIQINRN